MNRENHYWITAQSNAGQTILIYGGLSETEATQKALGIKDLPSFFNIIQLPTRNQARASQMLKGRKLDESGNLDDSIQNLRHKITRGDDGNC